MMYIALIIIVVCVAVFMLYAAREDGNRPSNKVDNNLVDNRILHYIETDKAKYYILDLKSGTNTANDTAIYRVDKFTNKGEFIEQNDIFDESWGRLGGDSYTSFIRGVLRIAYNYMKKRNEPILNDKKMV